MRRVLLVDDEKHSRTGLRAILERYDTAFKDIRESSCGEDAFNKLSFEKYDLVVLDIEMPNVNGIELMKKMQKLPYKPKIIILSGYDKFNYAAQSMKYGAKVYLLKPVKNSELIEALVNIEKELESEENINYTKDKAVEIIDRLRINELNYVLMNDNLSKQEITDILDTISLDILKKEFQIALMDIKTDRSHDKEYYEVNIKIHIDFYMHGKEGTVISFMDSDNNMVLIGDKSIDFKQLQRYIKQNAGLDCTLGISEAGSSVSDIHKAYYQAGEARKYRIFKTSGSVIFFSAISGRSSEYSVPGELIRKAAQYIGTSRMNELEDTLFQIFNIDKLNSYSIKYLEDIVENINQTVINPLLKRCKEDGFNIFEQYENITFLYSFNNIKDYFYSLKSLIMDASSYFIMLKSTFKGKVDIDKALQFIDENYDKDIDMTTVSNYVSTNYTYFSYLFKEHTGLSFVNFLKKVRVEKAKELLKNTNFKIFEVAHKVGIKNAKHFSKIFRATTGISPNEYKHKLL